MAPIAPVARRLSGLGLCLEPPGPPRPDNGVLAQATTAAAAAERLGFTSVWVTETRAEPPDGVPYEAFSLLGALAVSTGAVHLGAVAEPDQRRAPSILAKIVTGIDVISHGRAVLSLDGDRGNPGDAERLVEALAVARAVLEDEHPSVDGRIYSVADAVNRPAPVQPDGVPLVVFLHGPGRGRVLLEACARSADAVVVCGGLDAVEDAVSVVRGWAGGRRARPGDRAAVLGRFSGDGDGTPEAFVSAVRGAGADGCLVGLPAPWSEEAAAALGVSW